MLKPQIDTRSQSETVKIKLNWATLKFLGPANIHLEKLFNEKYFVKNLKHIRYCHIIAIFFYLVAGFIDYLLFPNDLAILLSVRFLIVVPIFIAGYLFSYSRHYQKVWQKVSFLYILVTGWSFIVFTMVAEPPDAYGYYVGILFCMMFGYTFIRERFIYASVAGLILVVGYFIISAFIIKMPYQNLFHSNFYLILANFLGMLIARHLEISARRDFYLEDKLSIEQDKVFELNSQLEQKVEERTRELRKEVAERTQAETKLKESERKYRLLAENVRDVIWSMDMDLNYTYISPAVEKIQGWHADEAIALTVEELLTPQSLEIALKLIEAHLATGEKTGDYNFTDRLELELYHKDGSTIQAEIIASSILDDDGKPIGILGVTRDITERKELETQLQRAQKMKSLGLLAGGVAHDLNNILSGIVSYPEMILLDLPENDKLRIPIETMQESGLRAAAIVQDLLTVARGVAVAKEALDLNGLIRDYFNSPEFKKLNQFHPSVTVSSDFDEDLLNINASNVHLRKVVMNLVSNAAEAIEGSGKVSIYTKNRYLKDRIKGYDDVTAGEYVVLEVADNGSGIPPHDLASIFEPFYTKKVMGRSGTGLGLAVVWNIVQDHKGYIDVASNERGTRFTLYFPVTRDGILETALSTPVEDYKGNNEIILVVDDVESQREISCKMLETLGYRTKAVASGEEAVRYVKEHHVDLLLLDMIMDPGMNGRETYEKILSFHPEQKAVIASGYAKTADVVAVQKMGAGLYIRKPLTLEKLGKAIKTGLGK